MRHAANIETSERLQKVLHFLSDYNWHSTFEIMKATQLCAVGSAISEIRHNGYEIDCKCVGHGLFEYKLIGKILLEGLENNISLGDDLKRGGYDPIVDNAPQEEPCMMQMSEIQEGLY